MLVLRTFLMLGGSIDLNPIDRKPIVLAAAAILLIAVLARVYMRKRRSTTAAYGKNWTRVRAGGEGTWVRTKGRSEIGGSREAN